MGTITPHGNEILIFTPHGKTPHGNDNPSWEREMSPQQIQSVRSLVACRGKAAAMAHIPLFLNGAELEKAKSLIREMRIDPDTRHIK
jgi:hypothetical protein